jgi:hypothetical protein
MFIGKVALSMPFNTFDPRSMAMGSTGVAVDDPSLAPFYNPAMLSAADHSKKFSFDLILGASLIDPGNLHTNWTTLNDVGKTLPTAGTDLNANSATLSSNATALTNNFTTLSSNIAILSGTTTITTSAEAATARTNMATVANNLSSVTTSMATVSSNSTTVGNNVNTVTADITKINQVLNALNTHPIQADLGAGAVLAIPGRKWGIAIYKDAWAAMGGALIYKDSSSVTTITAAGATIATNLLGIGASTGTATTELTTASTLLNDAITACSSAAIAAAGSYTTCQNTLTAASNKLTSAKNTVTTTSTTVTTNVGNISTAAATVSPGSTTLQSEIHMRAVAVTEAGMSISHEQVTNDIDWSWGITPKVMQLRLYDATLATTSKVSNLTGNDYLAYYSTLNFDAGIAKTYLSGWRTGLVVKNVIPQSFEFKNAPSAGATPIANGSTLYLNPQVRAGISYEYPKWFTVALDADLTRNDPAGLEDPSQCVALGGELSTSDWVQIRAGYRADLVNAARNIASIGFGLSPRLPHFKTHFDFALTASPDIFTNGLDAATQVGIAMKFGLNF